MKRTFLFGLLGAILAIIYITAFNIILLLIGTSYDFVRFIDERWRYDLIKHIHLFESLGIVTIIFWIFLFWKFGFLNRRIFFWRNEHFNLKEFVVKVSLIIIIGFLAWQVQAKNFFMPVDCSVYPISSFGSSYGQIIYFFGLLSPLVPFAFAAFSLAYAIACFSEKREFFRRATIPLSGLALVGINIATIFFIRSYIDLDKNITMIPGLSKKPEQRFLAVLAGNNPVIKLQEYYDDYDCSPLKKNLVVFNDENENIIRRYLNEHRMSALRASGYYYLIRKSEQELNIGQEAKEYLKAFKATRSSSFHIFLMIRLDAANTDLLFHRMLTEISDEERYLIRGKSALKLSRIYSKYGELDRAEYWYKKALETGGIEDDWKPPKDAPFNKGMITGTIGINGEQNSYISIGLIPSKGVKSFLEFQSRQEPFAKYISFMYLRGGTAADKDGKFIISGLSEGKYVLLLSFVPEDGKTIKIVTSPGPITLSKDRPSIDVGTINLTTVPSSPHS